MRRLLAIGLAGVLGLGVAEIRAEEEDSTLLAKALNDAFASVYEKVAPSVVVIEARSQRDSQGTILPDGWESFFRLPPGYRRGDAPLQGSGVIIRPDGFIVTNHHVIATARPDSIEVSLQDGRRFTAEVVGVDDKTDLAVLKVDAGELLPAANLADSSQIRVGQFAFALGAPMELPYTFTFGLVSATGRSNLTRYTAYEDYIQTDAAINPGNSGGPLADIDGKVIGVNTLISGLSRGLGFAIPSNMVRDIATQLIEQGRVSRPWLGISIEGIEESPELRRLFQGLDSGVVVRGIIPDTPASNSELRAGDVILQVDGKAVGKAGDVQKAVLERAVGDRILLDVWRRGQSRAIEIDAGEQPVDTTAARSTPVIVPPDESTSELPPEPPAALPAPTSEDLGFEVEDATGRYQDSLRKAGAETGLVVTKVFPETPASISGLEAGDIITHLNDRPVESKDAFWESIKEANLDRGAMLGIVRDGEATFCILRP